MVTFSSRRILGRTKMLEFLNELEPASGNETFSLYLPPALPPAEIVTSGMKVASRSGVPTEIAELASSSPTGAALFYSPERKYLVMPPFPIAEKHAIGSLSTGRLCSLLSHEYMIALILVRLGAYAIGVCRGEDIVSSKVGTGLIHGRHKKGGSSQARFRRHREKQIESFLNRICRHLREQLAPHLQALDYVVCGGAWTTILLLQKQCPFFGRLDKPTLPPLLEIPEPRQAVLATAISRVYSSTVMEWRED